MVEQYKKKGVSIIGEDVSVANGDAKKVEENKSTEEKKQDNEENNDYNSDDTDSDYDVDKMMLSNKKSKNDEIDNKDNKKASEYIVEILSNEFMH